MEMIVDAFTYNGEEDILDLRLNILGDRVDRFVIVENCFTFSGREKELPLSFQRNRDRFKKGGHKIQYVPIDHRVLIQKYGSLADNHPNVPKSPAHWRTEFIQKEAIKEALSPDDAYRYDGLGNMTLWMGLRNDDLVFVGDVDEIWNPDRVDDLRGPVKKLKLKVYTYWLNNRSSEEFWGTIAGEYKYIKNECLNTIRTISPKIGERGWHFTSMAAGLKQKLEDSYTEESYASRPVMDNLEKNIQDNKDFLGRDFTYRIDESEWPGYLKQNREKYLHLLKDKV